MGYSCIQQPQSIPESCFGASAWTHARHTLEAHINFIFQTEAPYSSIRDIALNDALTWRAAAAISHVLAGPNVTAYCYCYSFRFLRKRANVVADSWGGAFGWGQKVSAARAASARCNLFFQLCSTARCGLRRCCAPLQRRQLLNSWAGNAQTPRFPSFDAAQAHGCKRNEMNASSFGLKCSDSERGNRRSAEQNKTNRI